MINMNRDKKAQNLSLIKVIGIPASLVYGMLVFGNLYIAITSSKLANKAIISGISYLGSLVFILGFTYIVEYIKRNIPNWLLWLREKLKKHQRIPLCLEKIDYLYVVYFDEVLFFGDLFNIVLCGVLSWKFSNCLRTILAVLL